MGRLDDYRARGRGESHLRPDKHPVLQAFSELYPMAYQEGALPTKVKELVALAISIVRDCEDCITYHALQLAGLGGTREEILDVLALILVVGGSTTIPTLRRTADILAGIHEEAADG
jgi:AhpD family alkylhydroperoxidase